MAKKQAPPAPAAELAEGYPSYRYHFMNERVLVMSLEDDERLGPGWYNSPKTAAKAAAEPAGKGGE